MAETLVADGKVGLREFLDDEACLAVIPTPGEQPLEISLYPEDDEWECECDRSPICEHIIAALMVVTSDAEPQTEASLRGRYPPRPKRIEVIQAAPEPPEKTVKPKRAFPGRRRKPARQTARVAPKKVRLPGHVAYRLYRSSYGLAVKRVVEFDNGDEVELHRRLTGADTGVSPAVETTDTDLLIQDVLGDEWDTGVVKASGASDLIQALALTENVTVDGVPVELRDEEFSSLAAFVDDFAADRVRVQVRPELPVDSFFGNGFAVKDGMLGRLGVDNELTGVEMQRLSLGQVYSVKQLAMLVVDGLVALRKKIRVEMLTDRLPDVVLSEPRAVVFVTCTEGSIEAEGFVAYGDPIIAKIIKRRLVPEAKTIPLREPDEEVPMASAIQHGLGLTPGVKVTYTGREAAVFAQRLDDWDDGDVIGDGWEDLLD